MPTLKDRIADLVKAAPGLTDREVTDRLLGERVGQQAVNQTARALEAVGQLVRRSRSDGKIGNYPNANTPLEHPGPIPSRPITVDGPSEDDVKRGVEAWLRTAGWQVVVRWGRDRGIDIDATRDGVRWIIEAKGVAAPVIKCASITSSACSVNCSNACTTQKRDTVSHFPKCLSSAGCGDAFLAWPSRAPEYLPCSWMLQGMLMKFATATKREANFESDAPWSTERGHAPWTAR